jgi:hypothetical protein
VHFLPPVQLLQLTMLCAATSRRSALRALPPAQHRVQHFSRSCSAREAGEEGVAATKGPEAARKTPLPGQGAGEGIPGVGQPTLTGPGSAVKARAWMLRSSAASARESGLGRTLAIAAGILLVAWVAKSAVFKHGSSEFEENEARNLAKLNEYFQQQSAQRNPVVDWDKVEQEAAAEMALLESWGGGQPAPSAPESSSS